jgi:hypothetical protein
MDRIS